MIENLVSVIIPVYNKEDYIDDCIESIVNQTYKNLEIIVLNDGSTDKSEQKIEKWQKKDKRIKYLKHQNIGLGPTRNRGIDVMSGDFVCFVDADDSIQSNMIESMIKEVTDKIDVIVCETFICEENEKSVRKTIEKEMILVKNNNIQEFFKSYYYKNIYSHNAWDKMYRREFIKENNILFGDNKKIFAEDTYFSLQVIINSPTILFLNKPLYNYHIREDSIMNSYKSNLIERNINLMNYAVNLFEDNSIDTNYLYVEWLNVIILELNNVLDSNFGFQKFRKSMKKFRNDSLLFHKKNKFKTQIRMIGMEENFIKRLLHYSATILHFAKLDSLADLLYYNVYKLVKGSYQDEK